MVSLILLHSCRKDDSLKIPDNNAKIENRSSDCISLSSQQAFCLGNYFQYRAIVLNNVPGYPSTCTFRVSFEYKWCTVGAGDLNEVQTLMRNFDILEIDCPQYEQEIDDLINNSCSTCPPVEDYIFNLEEKLIFLASVDIMKLLEQTQGFNFDCSLEVDNWFPFVYKYSQYTCHSYCLRKNAKVRGGLWTKPIRYECNGAICCSVTHSMCTDPITGELFAGISKISHGGVSNIQCTRDFITNPNQPCYFLTECLHTCN